MPVYTGITFSWHAVQRMRKRRITARDVELALRIGEGHPAHDQTWSYELGSLRVIVAELGTHAHIVTVIRLRSHS